MARAGIDVDNHRRGSINDHQGEMAGDCCRCDDGGGKHQRLRNVAREVVHKFIAQARRNTVDGILLA